MNIAIIPARGGSKRIPRKNIQLFAGKPIIAYSIRAAVDSGLFDQVMVSTDDAEIAEIAQQYGAVVPFYRSEATSNDFAGIAEVLIEVIEQYQEKGQIFDKVCCILPTAPFVASNDLTQSYNQWIGTDFDALFPVVRYSFPIQRALQFEGDSIKMIWPENRTVRSQDLMPTFHDAGLFYWVKVSVLLQEKKVWTEHTTAFEIDESRAQDIDTPEDWKIAELKFSILKNIDHES